MQHLEIATILKKIIKIIFKTSYLCITENHNETSYIIPTIEP